MTSLLLTFTLVAIDPGAGTTGFDFLRIPPTAREAAMGGAAVGAAGSPMSFWYSPAHATATEGQRAQVGYLNYVAGIHIGALGYNQLVAGRYGIGAGVVYLNSGTMKRTNEQGDELGTFSFSNTAVNVSGATRVMNDLTIGIGLQGLYGSTDTFFALGLTGNVGATYSLPVTGLSAGVAVTGLGYELKPYQQKRDPMPIDVAFGIGFSPTRTVSLTLDVRKPLDNRLIVRGGIEGWVAEILVVRAGYNSLGRDWQSGGGDDILAGLTTGLGVRHRGYQFDYCFVPMVELGMAHRISFSFGL